jgi:DNA-binding transcriptional LysR family regulator
LLTSPAVWEQMKGLERYYGCRLIVRRGNGIAITPEGEQLLEMVPALLAGLESTRAALKERGGALPATLTVATNLRVLAEEIAQGLSQFEHSHRSIRLRLLFTGNDVDKRVASGEVDVGFTLEPGPENTYLSAVEYEPAGEVDYLLVMPRRHPLARSRTLRLPQIVGERLVLAEAGGYSRRRVEEVMHRHNLTGELRIAVETSSDEYTLSCVRAGLGIGITVGTGRGPLYRGLAVRSLRRWFGTARLGLLWKRGAHVLLVQRELAAAVRRAVFE